MVAIQVEGDVSREEIAISEAMLACEPTPTHPSIHSLSSSNMMSYINEKTPVERDVENGGG